VCVCVCVCVCVSTWVEGRSNHANPMPPTPKPTGLNYWLINAFNGEWLRTEDPVPVRGGGGDGGRRKLKRELDALGLGLEGF
jgi:hypothetical protein